MNIKPVGHFYPEGEGATVYDIKFAWKVTGTTEPIPLYTHPAKTLTDEEMELAYYKCFGLKNKMPDNEKRRSYFKFARAILKKASDK